MKQFCVSVPAALASQRPVLATLPTRFRVDAEGTDVVALRGADLAFAAGAAVMVVEPGLAGATALRALTDSRAVTGLALRAAPALTAEAVALMQVPGDDQAMIVDADAETGGSLRAALFELLMLLDRLGCHAEAVRVLADTPSQITLGVTSTGSWQGVRVTARRSFRTRFSVETVSRSFRRAIAIDGAAVATAADVRLFDAGGTRAALPRYENGLRASWQSLHARLDGSGDTGGIDTAIRLLDLLDTARIDR
ncbi:hypothetical protein [Sphingomonas sp. G-3-2-10]|uniref:hypothetical protein n=1 Tax=Sphingomonas sp. G-3-2-10 TaxID=2728838 RepID=UPI00146EC827|nr:hypothetical protein [Sphingomonas sp. G-3-2-10]NML08082.1 hypothetical protein [Sphingomonas sp. G-3-2-10]